MNIYDIDRRLLALIDPDTGEPSSYEAVDALMMERDEKIKNAALWLKNEAALLEAIKAEREKLDARQKTVKRQIDWLKGLLDYACGGEKFENGAVRVSFRATESVKVINPDRVIEYLQTHDKDDCLNYKTPEIAKSRLKELLKSGVQIPGAWIEKGRSVIVK